MSKIERVPEREHPDSIDAKRRALAEWLEQWRSERERSDERLEAARQRFEILNRRLFELARRG
jgi:hypothetical protein